jgi:diguanylate cyclase (GGDEF)-like protein
MALALAFHALHAVVDLGGSSLDAFVGDGVYTAIELLAVGVCAARVLRRAEDRFAWGIICAGLLAWTAGDLVWTVSLENVSSPPYPSVADAFYLAMYPAIYCGLVLLMRAHFRHVGLAVWLDGVVVGLTLAAIGAALIFPALHAAGGKGNGAAVVINLSYLLCDLLLLVFLAVGFALAGWRPGRQWLLLALGTAVLAAADMLFLYQEAKGTYVTGRILDTMWPASMAILALAAWQPRPEVRRGAAMGFPAVVVPVLFGLVALGLLVTATTQHLTGLEVGLATGALLAVGARATSTYFEHAHMLRRQTHAAVTDALTGLGNRRRLTKDLERALQAGLDGPPSTLAFFDLDGFKGYNDSFGHSAGDAMLRRLGTALSLAVAGRGTAYRLGGDEFCLLLSGRYPRSDPLVARARSALAEQGSGFAVAASCGVAIVPEEAGSVTAALSLADERMYSDKGDGRAEHSQTQTVLLQLLTEREPTLGFGLDSEQLDELRRAAEQAISELRRAAGSQFDPGVVEALCQHLQELAPADLSVRASGAAARAS